VQQLAVVKERPPEVRRTARRLHCLLTLRKVAFLMRLGSNGPPPATLRAQSMPYQPAGRACTAWLARMSGPATACKGTPGSQKQ
jgi:hypothetical protein